jgi:predicted nucleic acid-binding protein
VATRRRIYVDSSAYLAVLLGEENSADAAGER